MSYLVDALKKAERERRAHRGADMQALADSEPLTRRSATARPLRWVVILLVLCNILLLAYLFLPDSLMRPWHTAAPDGEAPGGQAAASTAVTGGEQPAPIDAVTRTARPPGAGAEGRAPGSDPETPVAASNSDQRSAPSPAPADAEPAPSSGSARDGGGRVTYADEPLDGGSDAVSVDDGSASAATRQPLLPDGASRAAPSGNASVTRPDITINGHLYSTVPGRSFILVNGRRYHEGDRLAAGPAIEQIDATGATFTHRGERFHIEGPS